MPAKAKLTTRQESTTQVSSDNFAKGSELTYAEADSNFINLRDQSIAISDGTTTTDIEAGETITFSGATVSGNTVSITGGGGSGNLGNLQVNDTTLSPITTNDNLILTANGTGYVSILNDKLIVGTGSASFAEPVITTPSGSQEDITISTQEGNSSGIIKIQAEANQNILITPNGAGATLITNPSLLGTVNIKGISWPASDGTNNQVLSTNGAGTLSWKSISAGVDIVLTDFAFGVCVDSSGYATNQTSNDTTILTSAAVQSVVARGKTGTTSIPSFINSTIANVNGNGVRMYRFVLDNNITVASIQGFSGGQTITFFVHQDSVGGRTITWTDTIKWLGGVSTLSTGANKIDKIVLTNNGYNIFGEITKDYY